ncbi:GNAT family N-acetyltransferase [Halobacillus rhizosphaerae]|uniref:GNAT family N-acetyltransferase n=1 Tax=Halobacillus rhizosphaerae TaxID=3064889 RepID=UPI00398AD325
MNIHFTRLLTPTPSIVKAMNRWENDSTLIPLVRPNQDQTGLDRRTELNQQDLIKRLQDHHIYLIYLDKQLVGEMNFMVDPPHLYKYEPGTAWIGITIGEQEGRGKGIGYKAISYLEEQIKNEGLKRIELGVFEFNKQAISLYKRMGYSEIVSIRDFTFWQGRMWSDIRMEKYVNG